MDRPKFHRATAQGWHHVGHLRASNQRHVFGVVIEGGYWFEDGDVKLVTGRTARIVGPDREQGEGHVHRWCSGDDAVGKGQAGGKSGHDGPVVDDARVDGVEVGHGLVARQGKVLRVVIQRNRRVVDGDVDKYSVGAARVVRPHGVHRHVLDDGWCAPNGAVDQTEGEAGRCTWLNFPGGDLAAGQGGRQRRHDRVVHQCEVVGWIGEHRLLMQHGDVDIRLT